MGFSELEPGFWFLRSSVQQQHDPGLVLVFGLTAGVVLVLVSVSLVTSLGGECEVALAAVNRSRSAAATTCSHKWVRSAAPAGWVTDNRYQNVTPEQSG